MARCSMLCVCLIVFTAQAAFAEERSETANSPIAAEEHAMDPVLRIARHAYQKIDREIDDYTCVLTRRERVGRQLRESETMFMKVRNEKTEDGQVVRPFAVYCRFLSPSRVKGREVLFVEGENYGKFIVRNGGPQFGFITTALLPDSEAVMNESRYPITEAGIKNLVRRLIEIAEEEKRRDECVVQILSGAKINDRSCTLIQVTHPIRRDYFPALLSRVFVDDHTKLPIRYASYDWPKKEGEPPQLLEEYTYTNLKFNVGLTDADFSHQNEEYGFRKDFEPTPPVETGTGPITASRTTETGTTTAAMP